MICLVFHLVASLSTVAVFASFPASILLSPLALLSVVFLCMAICSSVHAQFKAEVKTVNVGDIKMAYYIRGEGKPLIMINGFISTMSLWDPALLDELAKHHKLILFDNRGVGLSTDTKKNNTTQG